MINRVEGITRLKKKNLDSRYLYYSSGAMLSRTSMLNADMGDSCI